MNQLKTIKKIHIDGINYFITILKLGEDSNIIGDYYVAYVYLDNPHLEDLTNCTYHNDNVYGIDTAHLVNLDMNLEQREKDAIKQITKLINSSFKKK
jgi:hypothetical protein